MAKLYCSECGSDHLVLAGKSTSEIDKKQRHQCKECGSRKKPRDTPLKRTLDTRVHQALLRRFTQKNEGTFIFTSAQNATGIFEPFFQSLLHCQKDHDAFLGIIPYLYKNPTSIWTENDQSNYWWDKDLVKFLVDADISINKNLKLMASVKVQPTAVSPLTGFETITNDKSGIFGHPKIELVSVATPQNKMAKLLTTTGVVTRPNYTNTKAGKMGLHHHTYGATIVTIRGGKFFLRQIIATKDGSFIDLDKLYTPAGVKKAPRLEGLVMGDTHAAFIDPAVKKATFDGPDSIVGFLKPKKLVWHDVDDAYSVSHHHQNDPFTIYAKHLSGRDDAAKEMFGTFSFLDEVTPPGTENIFVASNHPEHYSRFIKETDPRKLNPVNFKFWSETHLMMLESTQMLPNMAVTREPFELWAEKKLKCYKRSRFLTRDESCIIAGVEVGFHGDKGANGARGTIKGYGKVGVRVVVGHTHVAGIRDGAVQVGTNGYLQRGFNQGPNAWLHADCLIYANGKRSLLFIIDGEWR